MSATVSLRAETADRYVRLVPATVADGIAWTVVPGSAFADGNWAHRPAPIDIPDEDFSPPGIEQ